MYGKTQLHMQRACKICNWPFVLADVTGICINRYTLNFGSQTYILEIGNSIALLLLIYRAKSSEA